MWLGRIRWPQLLFAAATAYMAVLDRVALAASGNASRAALLLDIWFDPYQLVFAMMPFGFLVVLQQVAAATSPEVLLRATSWTRVGLLTARGIAGPLAAAIVWMGALGLAAGAGLPSGELGVRVGTASPGISLLILGVLMCLGTYVVLLTTALIGLVLPGALRPCWSLAVFGWVIVGFKRPEFTGVVNPYLLAFPSDGDTGLAPTPTAVRTAAILLLLSWGLLWSRDRWLRARPVLDPHWLWGIASGVVIVLAVVVPGWEGRREAFSAVWLGLAPDRPPPVLQFIPAVVVGVGPVLAWLQRLDLRLEGYVVWELPRCGSVRRWVWRELWWGGGGYAVALGAAVLASVVLVWARYPTEAGEWPGTRSVAVSIGWLIGMWLLTGWSWMALVLLARSLTSLTAAGVVTVTAGVALAYVAGRAGFPMLQGSLGLLEQPNADLVGRAVTQLALLVLAVAVLMVIGPRLLLDRVVQEGNRL